MFDLDAIHGTADLHSLLRDVAAFLDGVEQTGPSPAEAELAAQLGVLLSRLQSVLAPAPSPLFP
jgi:hypothetical protein